MDHPRGGACGHLLVTPVGVFDRGGARPVSTGDVLSIPSGMGQGGGRRVGFGQVRGIEDTEIVRDVSCSLPPASKGCLPLLKITYSVTDRSDRPLFEFCRSFTEQEIRLTEKNLRLLV